MTARPRRRRSAWCERPKWPVYLDSWAIFAEWCAAHGVELP